MKGYTRLVIAFVVLLVLYVVAEWNRPKPVDWDITLSKEDKNPFGGYILFHQLKDLFPSAAISSFRLPVYNQVKEFYQSNTAYLLIGPQIDMPASDVNELLHYVSKGNYAFLSAGSFGKTLMDTLHFNVRRRYDFVKSDSVTINLENPLLRASRNYGFRRMTLDGYLSRIDTAGSVVLGNNQLNDVNFIRMPYGAGALFVHVLPLCFSNYFMLKNNNAEYSAKALSYLPQNIRTIFWDEYYKLGPSGSQNPLRFVLTNVYLRWAFRIALAAMLLFILFETKRRQRVIPVVAPLKNSTLDFVETVGIVYFNRRDHKNIALKKINYFFEYIRSELFISTHVLNDDFIETLTKKSGMEQEKIASLVALIQEVQSQKQVTDALLLQLNSRIDEFYKFLQDS